MKQNFSNAKLIINVGVEEKVYEENNSMVI